MARQLPRSGSFSGVWWKLGDDADEQRRRLTDEEAAVKARIKKRRATARGVRRWMAFASISLEAAASVYALWKARRRGGIRFRDAAPAKKTSTLLLLLPVPAFAALLFAAFACFHKIIDAKDQKKLDRLRAERNKGKMMMRGSGSHHNMQKLIRIQEHGQDSADKASVAASAELNKTHSRLSFHIGDG